MIRHLTPSDLPEVVALYRRVLDVRRELDDARLVDYFKQIYFDHPWFDEVVVGEFPKQVDGYFDLPTGPGIGLDMDEEALRANPPVEIHPPEGYVKAGRSAWGSKQQTMWS